MGNGCRDPKPAAAPGGQPAHPHEPRHALAPRPAPALPQLRVDPGAPVALPSLRVDRGDLETQPFVRPRARRRRARLPGVETRARHLERAAEHPHREDGRRSRRRTDSGNARREAPRSWRHPPPATSGRRKGNSSSVELSEGDQGRRASRVARQSAKLTTLATGKAHHSRRAADTDALRAARSLRALDARCVVPLHSSSSSSVC